MPTHPMHPKPALMIYQNTGKSFLRTISSAKSQTKHPMKSSPSIYCDYEGDYTQPYSLVIGCPVSSFDVIPQGMVAKSIPTGFYAIFHAIGEHPKSLIETWGNIWQCPDLERTYTGDYEVYGDKFSGSPQEVVVCIAIEQEKDTRNLKNVLLK
jgi:predicted transcriptional regulator YdeE